MLDDLISRQAAIDALEGCQQYKVSTEDYAVDYAQVKTELMMLPAADVRENVHGEWVLDEYPHDGDCRCSACLMAIDQMHERNHNLLNAITGGKWWTFYKFCPNCGADMRERRKDAEIH